jgi:integrase
MSVIKRENSKYWYVQFQVNGRTVIRSSRSTSKKIAEQFEAQLRSKFHAQEFLGVKPQITLHEAVRHYCDSRRGTPSYVGSLSLARNINRLIPASTRLHDLSSHDLERFKRSRMAEGVSAQTIKHNLNLIRCSWKNAKKLGYLTSELEFPEIKIGRTPLRYLSDGEEKRLLEALDPMRTGRGLPRWDDRNEETRRNMQDAFDIVILLLDTGARYSEIANIEWSRINLDDLTIQLWRPKVQNETVLYMTDRSFGVLSRRFSAKVGLHVFSNRQGAARGYASQSIRKALRKAGLADCKIHTLRHTLASRLVQNGMSVYEVREILGHTDIKTTMRYAHLESKQVTSKARDVMNRLNTRSLQVA